MSKDNNILKGTDKLITEALGKITKCDKKLSTITFSREVAGCSSDLKLGTLVNDLWHKIENNWKTAGCRRGGSKNWRWNLQRSMHPENTSKETRLEKGLATVLPQERWANQIPTASGLMAPTADKKRNIDLAHWDGKKAVTLVELKVASNTPVYAAFELLRNALLLCLARTYPDKIEIAEKNVWTRITKAHLRVVAPQQFYDNRGKEYSLGIFEKALHVAVSNFGTTHGLEMSFGFRVFDLTDVLLNALEKAHACEAVL